MASYRKRGESWQVQIRREDHPPITKSFRLKSEASVWARTTEAAIDRGELVSNSRQQVEVKTLYDLLFRYQQTVTPKKRGSEKERLRINSLLTHPLCQTQIKHVTSQKLAHYRDERLRQVKGDTVRRELAIFSHAFNVAIREWGIGIHINPVSKIEKPTPGKGRARRVSNEEIDVLLGNCGKSNNVYLPFAIQLAIHTGMRKGELISMKWEHLNLAKSTLEIPETKTGFSRNIPISEAAKKVFLQIDNHDQERILNTTSNALRLSWDRLRLRAQLKDLRFHDLRHEAISRFFEMGLSLPEVALISGHREPRMLMRYTHLKAENIVGKLSGNHSGQ